MEQRTKSERELQAEEQLRQAKARLNKVRNDERKKARKEQDHHKFIMGGIIAKYFPECYEFTEQEMNRIIACAFKNKDILNMISVVVKERDMAIEANEIAADDGTAVGSSENLLMSDQEND